MCSGNKNELMQALPFPSLQTKHDVNMSCGNKTYICAQLIDMLIKKPMLQ